MKRRCITAHTLEPLRSRSFLDRMDSGAGAPGWGIAYGGDANVEGSRKENIRCWWTSSWRSEVVCVGTCQDQGGPAPETSETRREGAGMVWDSLFAIELHSFIARHVVGFHFWFHFWH